MRFDVVLPSLGDESDAVTEGTVAVWHAENGATVAEGDDLVELTTDKAAFVLPAPKAGTVVERRVNEGDKVAVGDVLCVLETAEA